MISINIDSIPILNIHGVDCRCIIFGISKSGAIDFLKNTGLSEIEDHYKI